jgi:oligosaccharide repeat unit polymerase
MTLFIIPIITFLGVIGGNYIFKNWINPLSIYTFTWGISIFLYELKLIAYPTVIPLAWFYIAGGFLTFLFGILTIYSARNLFAKNINISSESSLELGIFRDGGITLKYTVLLFGLISIYTAYDYWMVLLKMFGSIPAILINANVIYKMGSHREIKEFLPYLPAFGYVGIFFSGVYTAYKGKFSFLSFLPLIGVILKELATVGRGGMLLGLTEFIFTFYLFRSLLKTDISKRFKFSKTNAVISFTILILVITVSASLVRLTRNTGENYIGASRQLKELNKNLIITPSIYLYLSSNIGVFSKYVQLEIEEAGFGENSLLPIYGVLARFDLEERPEEIPRGYYVPMWTNSATYLREFHADFGLLGIFLLPYFIGLLVSWCWFKFFVAKNLIAFAILIHLFNIITFSVFGIITRSGYWWISLATVIIFLPIVNSTSMFISRLKQEIPQ